MVLVRAILSAHSRVWKCLDVIYIEFRMGILPSKFGAYRLFVWPVNGKSNLHNYDHFVSEIGNAHAQYHVISKYGVSANHTFGIADPTLPIHGATMTIKGRLLLSVPIVKRFFGRKFSTFLPKFDLLGIKRVQNRNPIWRPPPCWVYFRFTFWHYFEDYGGKMCLHTKLDANRTIFGEVITFHKFSRWRPPRNVTSLFAILDHTRSRRDGPNLLFKFDFRSLITFSNLAILGFLSLCM